MCAEVLMGSFLLDWRYAMRQLRKSPGFTLTALLTLTFGIGATIAIFSIVEGVLLRPLPFPHPDRLVFLGDILDGVQHQETGAPSVTAPGVLTYIRETHGFSGLGAYRTSVYELSGLSNAEQINAARLTAGVFPTLGVAPVLGRAFTLQEDKSGEQVAVLSYQTWRSRFQGDPQILGRKVLLDRRPYQIIGVMPRDFEFPLVPGQLNRCELWVPMSFTQAELLQGAGNWGYYLVGRLKAGMTRESAEQDAMAAAREIMRNFPPALSRRRIHPAVRQLDQITVAEVRPMIHTLFLAVVVVLFIGCANLAGLLLVRGLRRRREISLRMALGASAATVFRQPLFEALLLSLGGALLGLMLADVALRIGVSFLPETLPRIHSISLDWQVVAVALGIAVLTGILCGLLPGLAATVTDVNQGLKEGGRTGTGGSGQAWLRSAWVITELAVALVLLTASGLLLRSFEKMRSVGLGFRTDHTLTASYSLPRQQYSTQAAVDTFNLTLRSKLEQLPGAQAVGMTSLLPASGTTYLATFTPEGYIPPKGAGLNIAWIPEVMGDYFSAQGIAVVRGRDFTSADRASARLVAIVNRALAERYWPGQDPIGKRLHRGAREAVLPWLTIVGEINDVKQLADEPTELEIYIPSDQSRADVGSFASPDMLTGTSGSIVVRGELPPEMMTASMKAVVRSIDPQLPLTNVESMDRVVTEGQAPRRFNTALMSAFAGAALLLALLGIYSVTAFSTSMRTQEIAIRFALGSQRSDIMRLILISAAKLGLLGCSIGVVAAFFATRLLRSFLFQVDSLDPVVLLLAAAAILLLTFGAAVIPARRAASVEPIEALRAG
jgi:putative ABC transport system permease protein